MTTLRRLYRRNPNSGDGSSYCPILFLISTIPPLPRPISSISSLEAYLSRNLQCGQHDQFTISQHEQTRCKILDWGIPSSRLSYRSIVCFFDLPIFQAIQRHLPCNPYLKFEVDQVILPVFQYKHSISGVIVSVHDIM